VLDHARLAFGAGAPASLVVRPEAALAAARSGGAVAVLALDAESAWWGRLLAEPRLRVIAALPDLASLGPVSALAVAERAPEPTGADLTFWVTDARENAAAIADALGADGVASLPLAEAGGLRLFTLAGFYQEGDARLARAPGRLSGVIGSAPAPLAV